MKSLDKHNTFLIVDLECTCWENDRSRPHETIEIGSVVYRTGEGVLDEFQRFVRPRLHPELSAFCTELTSIVQADVDGAPTFPDALAAWLAWAESYRPWVLASWGEFDRNQLHRDCDLHGIAYPFDDHVNIKRAFAKYQGCQPCGMAKALRLAGLTLEGMHHRGIDDARNITRLLDLTLARHRATTSGE